jgi:hypothetical protein
MSVHSKRPGPGAYDHLWSLLPVFLAFLTVIVFAAVTDERPLRAGNVIEVEAPPADLYVPAGPDASVPAAEAAMARLHDAVAEPVATF